MTRRVASALARLALPALTASMLVAGGCATSGPYWDREDQGAAEAAELRERVARLEAQLAAANERYAALQSRADALDRELERLRDQAAAPATQLPETFEAPERVPAPRERSEIEQSDLSELGELPEASALGAPAPPPSDAEAGPRELYERSLELLEQRRLAEAEAGFTRFLAASPDSDLADNAQFWLAESALRRSDVTSALAGFRAVVEIYPEGNKVPDALLKVGFCLATTGDAESAATVYRELLARFPESAAAETARQRLGTP